MTGASGESTRGEGRRAEEGEDLAGRLLVRWTRALQAHKWLLTIVLLVQAGIFSAFSAWIVWQPDVLLFFSADSPEVRNVRAVGQEPGLANQLRLDVHFSGAAAGNEKAEVAATARALARALEASGQFRSVWTGAGDAELAAAYGRLLEQAPLLLTAEERAAVEARATPEFLQRRFATVQAHLADPDGEFLARQLAGDPLDVASFITGRLQGLSPGGGEAASFQDGLLMTRDGAGRFHAMIVTEPLSLPSNEKAAEATLAATNAAVDRVVKQHPGAAVWVVGAHRGYVENARRVKADVSRVSVLGALAVGLAIAWYFRRVSAAVLCFIPPMVGVGLALGLAGIFHVTLPLLLLGFAGLLCGSTTDYGIQIIAQCRRLFAERGGWDGDIPALAARRLLGPISMSVTTSVTGFAALALSASPGLRALGLFVAGATVCIWVVTFLVLPAYLGPWVLAKSRVGEKNTYGVQVLAWGGRRLKPVLRAVGPWLGGAVFFGATAYLTVGALHVRFNSDPRSLDGSPARLLADEDSFSQVWGDPRNHAIVLVNGKTAEAALGRLAQVRDYLSDQERDGLIAQVTSPAAILPDQETMRERAAAWREFWTGQRREAFKSALAGAATAHGFKGAGFTGYADRVGEMTPQDAEARLAESPARLFPGFIEKSAEGVTLASIVRMRSDVSLRRETAWGPELRAQYPGTVILGGKLLFFDATERARAEGERLLPWCVLAILLPLIVYFRRLTRAWLVMVCLVVGLVWVLGAAADFGGGLNLLSLVPVLFTLGVAVDYGIYLAAGSGGGLGATGRAIACGVHTAVVDRHSMTSLELRWVTPGKPGAICDRLGATGMCALTTILGSGSLVFAGHPAMRWLGITLVVGVTGGILAAVFVVRPVGRWFEGRVGPGIAIPGLGWGGRVWRWVGRIVLNGGLAVLTLVLVVPVVGEMMLAREEPAGARGARVFPKMVQTGRRRFEVGDSWMRWRGTKEGSGIWEIKLVGGPFERGNAVGQLASPLDFRIETEMLEQLDSFLPEEWARWVVLRGVGLNMVSLPQYVPLEYQQEIWASAVGGADPHRYLAPSYPRILSYHALHDVSQMLIDNPLIVPNSFACTGVVSLPGYSGGGVDGADGATGRRGDAARGGGHLMLARNFDFEGGESFGRQKSVTFVAPPAGEGIAFAHVAWPGLAGCVTGMNAERIAVFLNAAATSDYRRIGTPTILMAREILQQAHSIGDAERIIRRTQVFVSDIIVVADGKTGEAAVFEKSPAGMDYYEVRESTVVANHLITPRFAGDPVNKERMTEGTTFQRWRRARELLDGMKGEVTAEKLAGLLRDKKGLGGKDIGLGNRNAIDGMIACHSVVMDVTAGRMWVAAWPYAEGEFLEFDMAGTMKDGKAIAADGMMGDGTWERVLASRAAEGEAVRAIGAKDWVRAKALAMKAIGGNPDFYFGHEILGRALMMGGDLAGARRELLRAKELDPPYAKRRAEIEGLVERCVVR